MYCNNYFISYKVSDNATVLAVENTMRPTFSTLAEQLKQHYSDVLESDMSITSSP